MNDLVSTLIEGNDEVIKERYEALVALEIRKKYSPNQEYAILRKKLAGIDNGEFEEYNSYVEQCKIIAKSKLSE